MNEKTHERNCMGHASEIGCVDIFSNRRFLSPKSPSAGPQINIHKENIFQKLLHSPGKCAEEHADEHVVSMDSRSKQQIKLSTKLTGTKKEESGYNFIRIFSNIIIIFVGFLFLCVPVWSRLTIHVKHEPCGKI